MVISLLGPTEDWFWEYIEEKTPGDGKGERDGKSNDLKFFRRFL